MLAQDEITITIDGKRIHLRPSLRAAYRLERRHGGFAPLILAVQDGRLTVLADVIAEASDRYSTIPDVLRRLDAFPLKKGIELISAPVLTLVLAMAGVDGDHQHGNSETENRITFAQYFEKLFGMATGVLGWPPETAWAATPAEITAAYNARIELLSAIFGGSNTSTDPASQLNHTEEDVQSGFAKLKMFASTGQNKAR